MAPKLIIGAMMRKLIHVAFGVLKPGKMFDPVLRGLQTYVLELTEDPTGLTGWRNVGVTKKSSHTITGLVSGRRYWVRVAAVGAAGQGPWSEVATKVAP